MKHLLPLLALLALPACASVMEGSTQEIAINTTPEGANCAITRNGQNIGRINPTPGAVVIEKTKYDIIITCTKTGYGKAVYHNVSGSEGATVGNIILGGGIGWAIDSANGSDNRYDSPLNIDLPKSGTANYRSPTYEERENRANAGQEQSGARKR